MSKTVKFSELESGQQFYNPHWYGHRPNDKSEIWTKTEPSVHRYDLDGKEIAPPKKYNCKHDAFIWWLTDDQEVIKA